MTPDTRSDDEDTAERKICQARPEKSEESWHQYVSITTSPFSEAACGSNRSVAASLNSQHVNKNAIFTYKYAWKGYTITVAHAFHIHMQVLAGIGHFHLVQNNSG